MMRHDESLLWAYAAREMDEDERRVMTEHLGDCPECRERLATVQVAREALESAREAWPVIDWARPDAAVGALVEKRMASTARRPWLNKLMLAGAVSAALVVGAFALVRWQARAPEAPVTLADVTPPAPPVAPLIRVDRAEGLTRVGAKTAEVTDGAVLSGGDVLRTSLAGKAFVHLPDESHVRVAGGTQLALTRAEADDVALTLERGRVGVRASHVDRRGFVVHTGGMSVHVVGTVFSVSNTGDAMEVAVSEGKVRVELPNGDALMVAAGQRMRLDSRSQKPQRLKLTPGLERELSELTEVADATAAVEQQVVIAAVGGSPSVPPMVVAKGAPRTLPRFSAEESARRQVTPVGTVAPSAGGVPAEPSAPVTQRLEPVTQVEVEGPGSAFPSMAGGVLKGMPVATDEAKPASSPAEWSGLPEPKAEEWAPMPLAAKPAAADESAPPPAVKKGVAPKDLETLFLQRAEEAIAKGDCERFQLGLEDIAQDAERNARSEQARVLRARCFEAQLRPRQALNEYKKYLSEYPAGRLVEEAKAAVGN